MEKPLSVAREDFVSELVNLINSSGLPMFVVLDVLKATESEVQEAAKKQYEMERKEYEESKKVKEETTDESSN